VGHGGQIRDDRFARDVLAQDDRQQALGVDELVAATSSRKETMSRTALGSSMPITVRPGMAETRAEIALMLRAISSARPITRLALMPGAGSSSYMVTTGPVRTAVISPFTLKSSSTFSSRRALRSSASLSILGWRWRAVPPAGRWRQRELVEQVVLARGGLGRRGRAALGIADLGRAAGRCGIGGDHRAAGIERHVVVVPGLVLIIIMRGLSGSSALALGARRWRAGSARHPRPRAGRGAGTPEWTTGAAS
jgi:hypothetical protein